MEDEMRTIFPRTKSEIVRRNRVFNSKQVRFIILNRYQNEQGFLTKFFYRIQVKLDT